MAGRINYFIFQTFAFILRSNTLLHNALEKRRLMNYYKLPQKMPVSRIINKSVKRSISDRLKIILTEHEKMYDFWQVNLRPKLNHTRQKEVERKFKKHIQALKITIHFLTPFYENYDDEPMFVVKKKKN